MTLTGVAMVVAWDAPVRLVPLRIGADAGGLRTVRVDPGVRLPGIAAVDATTVTVDGLTLLARLDPVRSGSGSGAGPGPGSGAGAGTLAGLLDALRRDALRLDALRREEVPGGASVQDGAVPVAVVGSPFTLAVLAALTRVPVGVRCTYAELAAAAGRPRAVRATASVMARNRVPLVLPCHRVVPSSGRTGRYGWGEDVKVALLAAEEPAG
jgi:methylated-DNA-[protein]-cysteine S-methyltransferase